MEEEKKVETFLYPNLAHKLNEAQDLYKYVLL